MEDGGNEKGGLPLVKSRRDQTCQRGQRVLPPFEIWIVSSSGGHHVLTEVLRDGVCGMLARAIEVAVAA